MAHLLSEEDFRGEINVAGTEQTIVAEELCRFIHDYEPRFMEAVLGYDLSKLFYDGAAESSPDQRWIDLLNGVVYDNNGRNTNWRGLKPLVGRYVYYFYFRNLARLATTAGEKIPQADNATAPQVSVLAYDRWGRMLSELPCLADYLRNCKDGDDLVYPEWDNGDTTMPIFGSGVNQWGI